MDIACKRIVKLKNMLDSSDNKRLNYLCGLNTSIMSINTKFILERFGSLEGMGLPNQNEEFYHRASILDELVACRDGLMSLEGFSSEEVDNMIFTIYVIQ